MLKYNCTIVCLLLKKCSCRVPLSQVLFWDSNWGRSYIHKQYLVPMLVQNAPDLCSQELALRCCVTVEKLPASLCLFSYPWRNGINERLARGIKIRPPKLENYDHSTSSAKQIFVSFQWLRDFVDFYFKIHSLLYLSSRSSRQAY